MKSGQQVKLIERKKSKALEMGRWYRVFLRNLGGGAARNEGKKTVDGAIKSLGRRRMREGTLERWQLV